MAVAQSTGHFPTSNSQDPGKKCGITVESGVATPSANRHLLENLFRFIGVVNSTAAESFYLPCDPLPLTLEVVCCPHGIRHHYFRHLTFLSTRDRLASLHSPFLCQEYLQT